MGKRNIVFGLVVSALFSATAFGQGSSRESGEAQWIWSPSGKNVAFFRKRFFIKKPVYGKIAIACDDRYALYINGRRVGAGDDWRVLQQHDIREYLNQGRNLIAIRAEKRSRGRRPGLVARVILRSAGGTFVSYSTDKSWQCSPTEAPRWNWVNFDDSRWKKAQSLGEFGRAKPWGKMIRPAGGAMAGRFKLPSGFHVERVVAPDQCGSLVSMTFDEWGNILAAREGEGILLIEDRNEDGALETIVPFSDKMKNCQGILAVNREAYAIGEGPDGTGLYRLIDNDGDGTGETVQRLLAFKGEMSEHGAHALTLGPDGWIYVVVGNHSAVEKTPAATSPYRRWYEGELIPRQEDPGGHAVGIKAPGGTIVRLTLDGKTVETFAGGLRNPYDIAFNRDGELFSYDADMEWDEGAPWYRGTRLVHLVPGGEYGWRSGWAKWPKYFIDSLPPLLESGRGSPTGLELYDHNKFPEKYRGALFMGDWTLGRIMAITTTPAHGTYRAKSEVFLEGKPLNVTDLAVGPDGWLYFCTGGRGTEGGIYRVVYRGRIDRPRALAEIGRAVRQPQFHSAFARDVIATVQEEMGEIWDRQLMALVTDKKAAARDRVRALELMHLYGPFPQPPLLLLLSRDRDFALRAKTADLMSLHTSSRTNERLVALLADAHPNVRRKACEALVRCGHRPPVDKVLPLLTDANRFVTWAARRLLEEIPTDQWRTAVLESRVPRVFNLGATALMTVEPNEATGQAVLHEASRVIGEFLNDADFVDLLRVIQLALHRGQVSPDHVSSELRNQLADEYPALADKNPIGGRRINRELARLLVYLQEPSVASGLIDQIRSDEPLMEKLHVAQHARYLSRGWLLDQKLELLEFYERARKAETGYSVSRYVENVSREFAAAFDPQERHEVIQGAQRWPTAALGALLLLPEDTSPAMLARLQTLDQRLNDVDGEPARRLQTGIAAVLARSRRPESMAYLRTVFENDPARRVTIAMGLAQSPGGKNWPLLIRALPVLQGPAAIEVLDKLKLVDGGPPRNPESVRQVILCGLRLKEEGAQHAIGLLEYWFEQQLSRPGDRWDVALKSWQDWFVRKYPDSPPPELPKTTEANKWAFDELLAHLGDEKTRGSATRGAKAFVKAQCSKCHRFGNVGEVAGPDLTTVARRFHKREVLESILYPSHVISDQYASKTVITEDGRSFTGIVGSGGPDSLIVLQTSGKKVRIPRNNVAEVVPSKLSAMPEGLLNDLDLQEVVDLFEYLYESPSQGDSR